MCIGLWQLNMVVINRLAFIVIFGTLLVATFGAGIFDVVFPDVVPLRPYTAVFQTAHTVSSPFENIRLPILQIPIMLIIVAMAMLALFTVTFLFPHLTPSLIISPLGARGSHSRANRRTSGAGWKDTSQKQPLTIEEQFRILMQIFGKPKMVIIYEKQKDTANGKSR